MKEILQVILPLALIFGFFALIYFGICAIKNIVESISIKKEQKKIENENVMLKKQSEIADERAKKGLVEILNTYGEFPTESEIDEIFNTANIVLGKYGSEGFSEFILNWIPNGMPNLDSFIEKVNKSISLIIPSLSKETSFYPMLVINKDDITDNDLYYLYNHQKYSVEEKDQEYFRLNYNQAAIIIIYSRIDRLKEVNETAALDLEKKIEDLLNGKAVISIPEWD